MKRKIIIIVDCDASEDLDTFIRTAIHTENELTGNNVNIKHVETEDLL